MENQEKNIKEYENNFLKKEKFGAQETRSKLVNTLSINPLQILEKERKSAAIIALQNKWMETEKNVALINAIKFSKKEILIGNTSWKHKNMTGRKYDIWIWNNDTKQQYYNFEERKFEARKQWIILPEKEDFIDTLNALPGDFSEKDWGISWYILAIILWEEKTGYYDDLGRFYSKGKYGYLGSVSEYSKDKSRDFECRRDKHGLENKGGLFCNKKNYRVTCRPIAK